MMGQAHRIKRGKLMNTIGIALISFSIGLIISWKLAERDIKNAKKKTKKQRMRKRKNIFTEKYFR